MNRRRVPKTVISAEISSTLCSRIRRKRFNIRARRRGVVLAHPRNPALTTLTGLATSAALVSDTSPVNSPVEGSYAGDVRPLVPLVFLPPMECSI